MLWTGFEIRLDPMLTEDVEDWSRVRSPSRARRRMRLGHKQNVTVKRIPSARMYGIDNVILMHPDMLTKFKDLPNALRPHTSPY